MLHLPHKQNEGMMPKQTGPTGIKTKTVRIPLYIIEFLKRIGEPRELIEKTLKSHFGIKEEDK